MGAEANATSFGGGLKLVGGWKSWKIGRCLAETLAGISPGQLHRGQAAAVSLTQATDLGAVYSLDEIRGVAEVAKARGLKLHMDGARFANATARLGCSPAELTWRSGIDIMSFGATKNGGALCDAIVVFAPGLPKTCGAPAPRRQTIENALCLRTADRLCRERPLARHGPRLKCNSSALRRSA